MCAVSMVGDFYRDKWLPYTAVPMPTVPWSLSTTSVTWPPIPHHITREEFDALRREVLDMKELLRRAKEYDARNDQVDCEVEEKLAVLRKVAELVGVDLKDVIV